MTNDDTLLAGFLDRSLSEEQLLELEARKAASPEFAHQFSNMLALENMLTTATPQVAIPAHFLNTVENAVAAKVLTGGGAAGGFLSGLSATWSWLGGAALALVSASAIYYYNQPTPVAVVQPAPSNLQTLSNQAPSEALPEPPAVILDEPAVVSTPRAEGPTPAVKPATNPGANSDLTANSSKQQVLDALTQEYDAAVASGDLVNATLKASLLGKTYRLNSDLASSEDYFAKAVIHARKAKLAVEETNALGEQAITSLARGNETAARLLLNQAISRGSQTGSDVSVWTQKLKDLR